ncbi:MAG: tRNA (guanosine(37)-N1)-methyltransferase TrmD [Proteobacteria bacterium]|jgi:tRNA (guanine37-N1)-methyltransferase|nr:tRNA (guanosine(37)-N1)-methyltransferase TrmD [Alphaproteobacteria bacterium]NCC03505.1 tRNA (guanosine(37)-N1)-methyltransferase TrmD [Pseudomonadota bacterium]
MAALPEPWHAQVLTLFPEMFPGPLGQSLAGRALQEGLWKLDVLQIRDYATDRHRTVDDTPYGGGAGMVMRPDIIATAVRDAQERFGPSRRLYLSPRGRVLDQALVTELAVTPSVLFLCGRYEGVDQRVLDAEGFEEVSLGDFILAGGEVAAMTVIEACTRLIPGVMGNEATSDEESFVGGLLEYPHYTRPPEWEGRAVPDVLISGHHERVKDWRRAQSEAITRQRRPDLWTKYEKEQKNG